MAPMGRVNRRPHRQRSRWPGPARDRRGTVMVEAAVVFPLVILTVVTCILICLFFYTETIEQSKMHMVLRNEAGALTERSQRLKPDPARSWAGSTERERRGIFHRVRGKEQVIMKSKGILARRIDANLESLWTASDGVLYVRYCTLTKRLGEEP